MQTAWNQNKNFLLQGYKPADQNGIDYTVIPSANNRQVDSSPGNRTKLFGGYTQSILCWVLINSVEIIRTLEGKIVTVLTYLS